MSKKQHARMPRKAGNAYRYVSAFAEANNIKKRAARSTRRAQSFQRALIMRCARMLAELRLLESAPDVDAQRKWVAEFQLHAPRLYAQAIALSGTLATECNATVRKKYPPCVSHRYVETLDERMRKAVTE